MEWHNYDGDITELYNSVGNISREPRKLGFYSVVLHVNMADFMNTFHAFMQIIFMAIMDLPGTNKQDIE